MKAKTKDSARPAFPNDVFLGGIPFVAIVKCPKRWTAPSEELFDSLIELNPGEGEAKSMTLAQLEKRVEQLEKLISGQLFPTPNRNAKWWLEHAGAFANDPGYDQIVHLGRKYRQSLKPKLRKAAR